MSARKIKTNKLDILKIKFIIKLFIDQYIRIVRFNILTHKQNIIIDYFSKEKHLLIVC